MEFETRLERFDSDLWHFHIPVPDGVAQKFLEKEQKRVICTLNGEVVFHCALMPKGDGSWFINVNKELRKKLGLKEGSVVNAELKMDDSKYGMPMPEELGELLAIDDEGSRYFHSLTPGKQRNLIYMVASPKTSDTRIKKALVIVDYLKASKGKLNFRELNEAFKIANQR